MPMSTITVAGISPTLRVLGPTQQFNYDQSLSAFQITNSFVPIVSIPSMTFSETRNNLFSGFRWIHETNNTDTHGSLVLQSFLNAQTTGIDLITFGEDNSISFNTFIQNNLDLNNNRIINAAAPIDPQDVVNKFYADSLVGATVTLTGAVTGSGIGTIATTLTDITVSQITDFTSATLAFRLDEFAVPTASIDLNNNRIINQAAPIDPQDGVNMLYVDTAVSGIATSVVLTGAVTGTGNTGTPIATTLTPITVSQITDFTSATLAFRLDEFAVPTASIDLNNNRIINQAAPIDPQDGVNMLYVDTAVSGIATSVVLTGAVTGTGNTGTPIATTLTPITVSQITDFTSATLAFRLDEFAVPTASIDLNNNRIINQAAPIDPQDGVNMLYVDTAVSGIATSVVLTGAVTGTGNTGTPIATTLTPITVSQITDFTSATLAFRLDEFAAPTASIDLNNNRIINQADPIDPQDGVTKLYSDSYRSAGCIYTFTTFSTVVTANVFTKMLGTTSTYYLQNFSAVGNNRLEYDAGLPINSILITASIVFTHNMGTNVFVSLAIYENGIQILPSIVGQHIEAQSDESLLSTTIVTTVSPGSYFEIFITADASGSINILNSTLTVKT